ncbi:tight adherence protein C [Pseudarthrobacter enclensis]|uniref:Secretion system protein n=1 Tax=Pseudarthrobacter enclensis TaxID=993070 RepID=A0A0V8IVY7_9MICC|nr:type II secretion system F family protein [Pseudarthrobacter enclensis]KSU78930.1 secretion system protein [Pseudarthrobacter enclensis]SCB79881.1 tight adherence protein C [Pseudarthrobacter enclensis]
MSPLALGAILAIVVPITYLVWSVVATDRVAIRNIQANLGQRARNAAPQNLSAEFSAMARKITPVGYVAWLDKQLAAMGRPKEWPLERLLVVKPLLALGAGLLGLFYFLVHPEPFRFAIFLGAAAFGYFAPDLLVRSTAEKRRARIRQELPNTLDQMLISVQAGLGFEAAMARTAQNGSGPLADEMTRTLQDMQVGRSRKEAYLAMSDRVDVPDLRSFIRAIVQADAYGIAIAKVLKIQAHEMRLKRRQRAEEHAMKIPVKILFPLIFFIFPTLFIILLGPAVMNIIAAFS